MDTSSYKITNSSNQSANKGGRPRGSTQVLVRKAREQAALGGPLPHEFLLSVARGELQLQRHLNKDTGEITTEYLAPDFPVRLDAAKAAAPYYAPKISTVEVISGVSNDELDRIIASAASEAGVSLSVDGEGEEDEAPQPTRERKRSTSST